MPLPNWLKEAREQARAKNALLHRGRERKINAKGKELMKNAQARAAAKALLVLFL